MARICEVCGKKPIFGKRISHSHRRTPRRWNVNIQKVRVLKDGTPQTLKVCTQCIKSSKIVRAY